MLIESAVDLWLFVVLKGRKTNAQKFENINNKQIIRKWIHIRNLMTVEYVMLFYYCIEFMHLLIWLERGGNNDAYEKA